MTNKHIKLSNEYLMHIISRILDYANDSFDEYDGSEFNSGKRLAYVEMVNVIKNDLDIKGYTLKDFGFEHIRDLEKLYLDR